MVVPSNLIDAKIYAPATVEFNKSKKTVKVEVRCELTNVGEDDYVLHAPTDDDVQFWHVLDENHREVFREAFTRPGRIPRGATHPFRGHTIAAGHSEHENQTLELQTRRLRHGHTYTVRGEFFGQIAEAEFVAFARTTARPRPKRSAAKKTTKKTVRKRKAVKRIAKKASKTKRKTTRKKKAAKRR